MHLNNFSQVGYFEGLETGHLPLGVSVDKIGEALCCLGGETIRHINHLLAVVYLADDDRAYRTIKEECSGKDDPRLALYFLARAIGQSQLTKGQDRVKGWLTKVTNRENETYGFGIVAMWKALGKRALTDATWAEDRMIGILTDRVGLLFHSDEGTNVMLGFAFCAVAEQETKSAISYARVTYPELCDDKFLKRLVEEAKRGVEDKTYKYSELLETAGAKKFLRAILNMRMSNEPMTPFIEHFTD
jgi:hypothetical protein